MQRGHIFVARSEQAIIVRLVGDLRHSAGDSTATSMQLDAYLETLAAEARERQIVIDLREALALDSTHLGVLARLAAARQGTQRPVVVSTREKITRLLRSMGLDTLFSIVETPVPEAAAGQPLEQEIETGPRAAGRVVLESHRALAALSEANQAAFGDVIALLEEELEK